MRNVYFTLLLMLCMSAHVKAGDWMKRLPDNLFVSQVSIPGTHDAATGNGVTLATFSQCQDIDVATQWSIGIRAFDFRPKVKDDYLNINHGISETKLRFDAALYLLRDSLKAHPSEFAIIHCLYASNYDNDKATYETMLRELLSREDLKDYFVPFRRNLTVGDMRGKILLLSRDQYAAKPITGGFFQSWCGWLDWNAQSSCSIIGESAASDYKSPLWVQDYANTKDSEGGVARKVSAVTEMLDHSTKHVTKDESDVVWVFNFASAYPGSLSTANGYRENATYTNAAIIEYLQTHEAGPTGVILMDYCVDRSPNEVDGKYLTRGRELVDTLIANNYKWLERRNRTVYDRVLDRIDKLYTKLQEVREAIATECADVAADFEDELAAAKEVIDQQKYEIDSLYAGWLFTESYTVDYTGTYKIIRQIEKDAEEAQAKFDEESDIHAVQVEHIGNDCQIFSLTGERLDALRRGTVNIVKFPDGKVRKVVCQ